MDRTSFYGLTISCTKQGFTLIEVLLSVTIATILMTGILVFISSSLGSQNATGKILQAHNSNAVFEKELQSTLGSVTAVYASGWSFDPYLTGIIVRTTWLDSPLTFIWLATSTGYCDSFSGSASETGTVQKLIIRRATTPKTQNASPYSVSMSGSSIYSWTTRIVGTLYPGDMLGTTGLETELNAPTAVIASGAYIYIADSMNDRILAYNTADMSISKLLWGEDGISKPTSLYFSGNTLLIASSGNGKIFAYQDSDDTGSDFRSTFRVSRPFVANKLQFTFSGIPSVMYPFTASDFHFTGVIGNASDTVSTGPTLVYTFTGWVQNFSTGSTDIYGVTIWGVGVAPSIPWIYIATMRFYSGATLQYSDDFPYFTKWDGDLSTSMGNILTTLSGGFQYPNTINGPNTWSGSMNWTNLLADNPPWDAMVSSLPIKDFITSLSGKILTVKYTEYSNYDCMNGKHQTRERFYKTLLP